MKTAFLLYVVGSAVTAVQGLAVVSETAATNNDLCSQPGQPCDIVKRAAHAAASALPEPEPWRYYRFNMKGWCSLPFMSCKKAKRDASPEANPNLLSAFERYARYYRHHLRKPKKAYHFDTYGWCSMPFMSCKRSTEDFATAIVKARDGTIKDASKSEAAAEIHHKIASANSKDVKAAANKIAEILAEELAILDSVPEADVKKCAQPGGDCEKAINDAFDLLESARDISDHVKDE